MSWGVWTDELYSFSCSSSVFVYGSSPISGLTWSYVAKASSDGFFVKGLSLSKIRNVVVGCRNAVERKL